jgi:hypothetical protein
VTVYKLSMLEPQQLANKPGLHNAVCNFPPRTNKLSGTGPNADDSPSPTQN